MALYRCMDCQASALGELPSDRSATFKRTPDLARLIHRELTHIMLMSALSGQWRQIQRGAALQDRAPLGFGIQRQLIDGRTAQRLLELLLVRL